jgi:hypothetical protein
VSPLVDALALAGWASMFRDGLVLDPRPIFGALSHLTLGSIIRLYPEQTGLHQIAEAEGWQRWDLLVAPWSWEIVRIGLARVTLQLKRESGLRSVLIYTDERALRPDELLSVCKGWGR